MTKFILKTYVKELFSKQNNQKFKIKQIAKYNLKNNNKLYTFDLFLEGGVYYDSINVFYTKDRNEALNRSRGHDWSYSANGICLYQNQCTYYVYNEYPKYYNYGSFKN